jgi:hypothetical protein
MFHVKHIAKAHPHLAWGWVAAAVVAGLRALGTTYLFGSALLGKKKKPAPTWGGQGMAKV